MKKILLSTVIIAFLFSVTTTDVLAQPTEGHPGKISGRSVGAAALSLIIWPGLGQVINDNPYDKDVTHALLGFTGVFRFWSCYDALVDRRGGVWKNRI